MVGPADRHAVFPTAPPTGCTRTNLARSWRIAPPVFRQNAYTASPLCAPGRASFMSGQLPSRTGVYDNAAEFKASAIPTYAPPFAPRGLCHLPFGQDCISSGPGQDANGFGAAPDDRHLTPADFRLDARLACKPGERIDLVVSQHGQRHRRPVWPRITNQLEYDDEGRLPGRTEALRPRPRQGCRGPWCLTVSFTHPHDPYVARRRFWDMYEECDTSSPRCRPCPTKIDDPHAQRIFDANGLAQVSTSPKMSIARSRRALFSPTSPYLDAKIGSPARRARPHAAGGRSVGLLSRITGDMLGERGLVVQDELLRGLRPGAPDDLCPPAWRRDWSPTRFSTI